MAIYFITETPKKLLAAYKKAIDDGHVSTWAYDTDGDFTHTADQWNRKAWLRPRVQDGKVLTLNILGPKDATLSTTVYAVYHGRFIESMLAHCDKLFREARATSLPVGGDVI
ncbi:MAG: hypothetical protein ACYCXT_04160 [Acidiferrobacteraceae bacterium]